jgi:hypothetical protein
VDTNYLSIRHCKYIFASPRHTELSFRADFMHDKYARIAKEHSPSWSRGKEPFSGGRGVEDPWEPPGEPKDMVVKGGEMHVMSRG